MGRLQIEDTLQNATSREIELLDWDTYFAYDTETFGENSPLGRKNKSEVVLKKYLREAIIRINKEYEIPDKVLDRVIEKFTEEDRLKSLININKEKYEYIKNGFTEKWTDKNGKEIEAKLKLIDFDEKSTDEEKNNYFLFVRELWVSTSIHTRRCDGVGFINGIPLVFVELKGSHRDVEFAYRENYSDYLKTIPQLFYYNAIVVLGNGKVGKYGAINSAYEYFNEWKRHTEEEPNDIKLTYKKMIEGLFEKDRLLDIVENYIKFDYDNKIVCRNHQYLGVERVLQNIKNRKELNRKLGTFWHTQGSGKSYSMVFLTEKVHRKISGNYTFLMLTDRKDLEDQLIDTFIGTGCIAKAEHSSTHASSGADLVDKLKNKSRYIFTIVNKFNQTSNEKYTDNDELIIISDEAHRTQYGTFATNMRKGAPNASFLGFTGTPLLGEEKLTEEYFGKYVSVYDFKMAVEDGATVKLYYENRGDKLTIENKNINAEISDYLEMFRSDYDLSDEDEEEIKRILGQKYNILTNPKRLERIAKDFVDHYTSNYKSGKAMFVAIDKITAVKMYNYIIQFWDEKIILVEEQISNLRESQKTLRDEKTKLLNWLKSTEICTIISGEQGEVDKFKKEGLDIIPHRKKMQEEDLETKFKDNKSQFRVAIVCAMWLTGFDVKSLATLYIDKPLKAHTLMQAIARVNRVYPGKSNGVIIDYGNVLTYLRKALAEYASGDTKGTIDPTFDSNELLEEFLRIIIGIIGEIADNNINLKKVIQEKSLDRQELLDEIENIFLTSLEKKEEFKQKVNRLQNLRKFLGTEPEVYEYDEEYSLLKEVVKNLTQEKPEKDFDEIIATIKKEVVDDSIAVLKSDKKIKRIDLSRIDLDKLKDEFRKMPRKNKLVNDFKENIGAKVRAMLERNSTRIALMEEYERIIAEYNSQKDDAYIESTFEELFKFLEKLNKEEQRKFVEGFTEEQLVILDLILSDKPVKKEEREKIKKLSVEILDVIKNRIVELDNWKEKVSTRAKIQELINQFLDKNMPEDYSSQDINYRTDILFRHFYEKYETAESSIYSNEVY